MVNNGDLGHRFVEWSLRERPIQGLVMIGSRVRACGEPGAADENSDFDFQVITSNVRLLEDRAAFERIGLGRIIAYVSRGGRLGSARKITALFVDGEIDLVIIPAAKLRLAKWTQKFGFANRLPGVRRALADLGAVLEGGFSIVKGRDRWGDFYQEVANRSAAIRLSESELLALADGFVCDYVSTIKKIHRGELRAAQRWLHHQLADVNYRFLHEVRRRALIPSFPDARRLEQFLTSAESDAISVEARLDSASLGTAVEKSAQTCRDLMHQLVGGLWQWPSELNRI